MVSAVEHELDAIVSVDTVMLMREVSFVCVPGNKTIAPLPPNALRAAEMVEHAVLVEVELPPQDELVLVDEGETYLL